MKYWGECRTIDDLWEAARTQHLILCITRSLECDCEQCKTCGWNKFNETEWGKVIETESSKIQSIKEEKI